MARYPKLWRPNCGPQVKRPRRKELQTDHTSFFGGHGKLFGWGTWWQLNMGSVVIWKHMKALSWVFSHLSSPWRIFLRGLIFFYLFLLLMLSFCSWLVSCNSWFELSEWRCRRSCRGGSSIGTAAGEVPTDHRSGPQRICHPSVTRLRCLHRCLEPAVSSSSNVIKLFPMPPVCDEELCMALRGFCTSTKS